MIVVVFPAPFGPSSPKISPLFTLKLVPLTASTRFRKKPMWKTFRSPSTSSTKSSLIEHPAQGSHHFVDLGVSHLRIERKRYPPRRNVLSHWQRSLVPRKAAELVNRE